MNNTNINNKNNKDKEQNTTSDEVNLLRSDTETEDIFTDAEEQLLLTPVESHVEAASMEQVPNAQISEAEAAMEKLSMVNTSLQTQEKTAQPIPNTSLQTHEKTAASTTKDDSTKEADTDRVYTRRQFTTASRRRIKANIRSGMTYDEAREKEIKRLVEKHGTELSTSSKRNRSNLNTPESAPLKKKSATDKAEDTGLNTVPPKQSQGMSYRDATATSKVAITHELHPVETLTEDQMEKIQNVFMDAIVEAEGSPKVQKVVQRDGWICITCFNTETRDWFLRVGKTIMPYEGARIRVVDGADMPKMHTCIMHISKNQARDYTKNQLMQRVKKQNEDIDTTLWKAIKAEPSAKGDVTLIFSADAASLPALHRQNDELWVNLGKFPVKIRGIKQVERKKQPADRKGRSGISSRPQRPEKRESRRNDDRDLLSSRHHERRRHEDRRPLERRRVEEERSHRRDSERDSRREETSSSRRRHERSPRRREERSPRRNATNKQGGSSSGRPRTSNASSSKTANDGKMEAPKASPRREPSLKNTKN